jgi:hypothetical protein
MPQTAITVDQVLNHCLVAYGNGTGGLPTKLDAIDDLVQFFQVRFAAALKGDPQRWSDVDPPHTLERLFVLRCSEAIGRLAALEATKRGALSISIADQRTARALVIAANNPGPGVWCN